jgi:hypothetical protein
MRSNQPDADNTPDNTQHSQETDIHGPGGIRTRKHSNRAAEDPRLAPRRQWYRPIACYDYNFVNFVMT